VRKRRRKGKERKGKERKGKERKGKERKGKKRKGKWKMENGEERSSRPDISLNCIPPAIDLLASPILPKKGEGGREIIADGIKGDHR
jgi:hypothetical protein